MTGRTPAYHLPQCKRSCVQRPTRSYTSPQLELRETTLANIGTELTATYFRGTRPIDAIWTMPDIEVTNICAMPFGYGVGDHRAFILDVMTRSMVSHNLQPVKRPTARRLNTQIPRCSKQYNTILEQQFVHQIIAKLNTKLTN